MVQIIPTLFSTTEEEYKKRLDKVLSNDSFRDSWVHMDLMDNKFVQNEGVSLEVLKKYPIPLNKEAHLMLLDPDEWIKGLAEIKVNRIIFPVEINKDIAGLINQIKNKGIEASLSINPETPVEKVEPYINDLDGVLLMGIKPGSEGQQLNPITFEKIRSIRNKGWQVKIGIDGGVKDTNAKKLVEAGIDYLAIGSFLFNGDIDENLEKLWEALKLP